MRNPKTTTLGILGIVGGLIAVAQHAIGAGAMGPADWSQALTVLLVGLGLVRSQDGGV